MTFFNKVKVIFNKIKYIFVVLLLFPLCGLSGEGEKLIPLKELLGSPDIRLLRLSPGGDRVAIGGVAKGFTYLGVYDVTSSKAVSLIKVHPREELNLQKLWWLDNNTLLVETHRGYSNAGLKYRLISFSSGSSLDFVENKISARGRVIDALPEVDGKLLFQLHSARRAGSVKLYETSVESFKRGNFTKERQIKPRLKGAIGYDTEDGKVRFANKYDKEKILSSWWVLIESKKWKKLFEYDYRIGSFSPVGSLMNGNFLVLSNFESDKVSLYEFDLEAQRFVRKIYEHELYDLAGASYDEKLQKVSSVSYLQEGELHFTHFNTDDEVFAENVSRLFPGKRYSINDVSVDKMFKIVTVFSSDTPGDIYYYDELKALFIKLAESRSELSQYTLAKSEAFSVKAESGENIEGFLTIPNKPNGVLIVNPHGGPIGVADTRAFDLESQYFANRGYTILNVNFRGSRGYGKAFLTSGRGQFGLSIEDDITQAMLYVLKGKNFSNVCSLGASYGGYSAVMLAMRHPEIIDCVVARFGVFDLELLFNDRNIEMTDTRRKHVTHVVGEYGEHLRDRSPVFMIEKLKVPILISAGHKDSTATIEHSNRLKLMLQKSGKGFETLFYKNAYHGHRYWKDHRHEMAYIDDFIRRSLGLPFPETDNAKSIQNQELELIAEGFEYGFMLEKDLRKAERYQGRIKSSL